MGPFSLDVSDVLALIAIAFSVFTFWDTRPNAQFKRAQVEQMRILSVNAIVLFEQLHVLIEANVGSREIDSYLLTSLRENAKRLEGSLNATIGLGLWKEVLGRKNNSVPMFAAFSQSLLFAASNQTEDYEVWLKEHLIMGMLRLIEQCEKYQRDSDDELASVLHEYLKPDLREAAWTYLERSADLHDS